MSGENLRAKMWRGRDIFVGANSGENKRSLKLKRAEMKAGSIELRERGSQAEDVEVVCIAASWLKSAVLLECAS